MYNKLYDRLGKTPVVASVNNMEKVELAIQSPYEVIFFSREASLI